MYTFIVYLLHFLKISTNSKIGCLKIKVQVHLGTMERLTLNLL